MPRPETTSPLGVGGGRRRSSLADILNLEEDPPVLPTVNERSASSLSLKPGPGLFGADNPQNRVGPIRKERTRAIENPLGSPDDGRMLVDRRSSTSASLVMGEETRNCQGFLDDRRESTSSMRTDSSYDFGDQRTQVEPRPLFLLKKEEKEYESRRNSSPQPRPSANDVFPRPNPNQPRTLSLPGDYGSNREFYSKCLNMWKINAELQAQVQQLAREKEDLDRRINNANLGPKRKRHRRTAAEIERNFACTIPFCGKAYGSEASLNQHMKLKHGSSRTHRGFTHYNPNSSTK